MDCLASSTESESAEARRCLSGLVASAKVEVRPTRRWRKGEALLFAIVGSSFITDVMVECCIPLCSAAIFGKQGRRVLSLDRQCHRRIATSLLGVTHLQVPSTTSQS